jgi:predicted O-methyltransferase YrrM
MSTATAVQSRSPFVDAWDRVDQIDGWLSRREGELLHQAATRTPIDGFILELGAFRGKSTALLASTGRELVAVDPLHIGSDVAAGRTISEDDADALLNVVKSCGNANWIRFESTQVDPDVFPEIDLLYIDGDHEGDAPYNDFMHYKNRLKPGALVAFHDFEDVATVTQCVKRLEREGYLTFEQSAGSMYLGRFGEATPQVNGRKPIRAYVAMPHSHGIEPEAWESARDCLRGHSGILADVRRRSFSILTSNFNKSIVACLNSKHYDYVCLHHSDIQATPGWLGIMIRDMESVGAEVMHAAVAIKNADGFTSTAMAYSDDRWEPIRKITMHELHQLPLVFNIGHIQETVDATAKTPLPQYWRSGDEDNRQVPELSRLLQLGSDRANL